MKPVIALIGRPNVGKSTLFNCLTRSRDALVADQPGMTRDRNYGEGRIGDHAFIVIDTGGLSGEREDLDQRMAQQVWQAVTEADAVLFIVDARDSLLPGDEDIARQLRQLNKPVSLVINKIDGVDADVAASEFYRLGMGEPYAIAAAHGRGVASLVEQVFAQFPEAEMAEQEKPAGIKIAIVGKPNVGKSTLVNRILGEERVLALDLPGTTRDSIYIPFNRDGQDYVLIDTAGVRRRGKVSNVLEKFSVIKALQAIEEANVVVFVIDARQGVSDQDAHLLGFVLDAGRALVLAVNKWDGMTQDDKTSVKSELQRRLQFAEFARLHFISALHGTGVGNLFQSINRAYDSATKDLSTPYLTRILEDAVSAHQPPLVRGRRIKLRYAHQGGRNPPVIVIHGNQTEEVPRAYQRYLSNTFRDVLQLQGTPLRIEFKTGKNPYEGKRNVLTKRQITRKNRLKQYIQKKNKKQKK
jgi:GTP-binding protein